MSEVALPVFVEEGGRGCAGEGAAGQGQPKAANGKSPASSSTSSNTGVTVKHVSKAEMDKEWPFDLIKKNIYKKGASVSRSRSKEKFVCECRFDSSDPDSACGEGCLNRMLMIECERKSCPCGSKCRNQRLQRQQFSKVEVFQTERKGKGLKALQPIHAGDLVYEYCGEILDLLAFEHRMKQYNEEGRCHFYFMTLDSDHIIDATLKGALSRFINHSCDPNSETQKWTVNGETRIGFFAVRDIDPGEEITFDYKYERLGETAQPCYCGSSNCRGFLGAKREDGGSRRASSSSGPASFQARARRMARQRELTELSDKLWEICGKEGVLSNYRTVQSFIVLLKDPSKCPEYFHRLLAVLMETTNKTCLEGFVAKRGLTFLRNLLEASLENDHTDVLEQCLLVLDRLPVYTKNVVDSCGILSVLEKLQDHDVYDLQQLSKKLIGKWSVLKEVWVISRDPAATDRETKRLPVPATRRNDLRKSKLQSLEDEFSVRLELERAPAGAWELSVEGKADNVSQAAAHIKSYMESLRLMEAQRQQATAAPTPRQPSSQGRLPSTTTAQTISPQGSGNPFASPGQAPTPFTPLGLVSMQGPPANTAPMAVPPTQQQPGVVQQPQQVAMQMQMQQQPGVVQQPQQLAMQMQMQQPVLAGGGGTGVPSKAQEPCGLPCQMISSDTNAEEWAQKMPVHPDWAAVEDKQSGRVYYYNRFTKETTWDKPVVQRGPAVKDEPTPLKKALEEMREQEERRKQAEEQQRARRKEARRGGAGKGGDGTRLSKRVKSSRQKAGVTAAVAAAGAGAGGAGGGGGGVAGHSADDADETSARAAFKKEVSAMVIKFLKRYRTDDVKYGRITSSDDFKHLARKLTQAMVQKVAQRRGGDLRGVVVDKSMKAKIFDFVKASMKKCGPEYQRSVLHMDTAFS